VLHDHRGAPAAEPGAGGEPQRHVLARRRHVGEARMRLERPQEPLDERAGDAGEEVVPEPFEDLGQVAAGHAAPSLERSGDAAPGPLRTNSASRALNLASSTSWKMSSSGTTCG